MAKVMAWDRDGYTLLGTTHCHVFEFAARPVIEPTPIQLGDGSTLAPGDRVTYFGGRRTCAGYTRLELSRGHLEYLGLRQEQADGHDHCAVLFRWSECDDPLVLYGAFLIAGTPIRFVYTTQHVAGRIIETTTVRRVPTSMGHNGGPALDDAPRPAVTDEDRALLAELEAAAAHPRPEHIDIARRHPDTSALVRAIEDARHRGDRIAEQAARMQFPHRAGNCCFKIGGSKETVQLRDAYAMTRAAEDAKRQPMADKLRRQIRGRLAHAAARMRKTLGLPPAPRPAPAAPPFAPGARVEARRRRPDGIRWEPCEVVTVASSVYHVRFADGAELPRPPATLRSL